MKLYRQVQKFVNSKIQKRKYFEGNISIKKLKIEMSIRRTIFNIKNMKNSDYLNKI